MKLFLDDAGTGKGAPIVLVHGLGTDSTVWSSQIAHLRKTRRVLAPDLRGHGKSAHASEYTVQLCVDDLQETLPVLGEKFWLVGHSFSGAVVSRMAGQHPGQLAGVIFVDAVGDVTGAPPEAMAQFRKQHEGLDAAKLQELGHQMLAERSKPETKRRVLAALANMDPKAFGQLRESMAENPGKELLAKFHGPKFAIDDRDGGPNPRSASALPGVVTETIPGVGHWLMLDDPEALNRALDEVLR